MDQISQKRLVGGILRKQRDEMKRRITLQKPIQLSNAKPYNYPPFDLPEISISKTVLCHFLPALTPMLGRYIVFDISCSEDIYSFSIQLPREVKYVCTQFFLSA
jgi:hypothetical protein